MYIEALAKIRKDALENASTDLILVGCGDYTLLKEYISADPSLNWVLQFMSGLRQQSRQVLAAEATLILLGRPINFSE